MHQSQKIEFVWFSTLMVCFVCVFFNVPVVQWVYELTTVAEKGKQQGEKDRHNMLAYSPLRFSTKLSAVKLRRIDVLQFNVSNRRLRSIADEVKEMLKNSNDPWFHDRNVVENHMSTAAASAVFQKKTLQSFKHKHLHVKSTNWWNDCSPDMPVNAAWDPKRWSKHCASWLQSQMIVSMLWHEQLSMQTFSIDTTLCFWTEAFSVARWKLGDQVSWIVALNTSQASDSSFSDGVFSISASGQNETSPQHQHDLPNPFVFTLVWLKSCLSPSWVFLLKCLWWSLAWSTPKVHVACCRQTPISQMENPSVPWTPRFLKNRVIWHFHDALWQVDGDFESVAFTNNAK